MALAEQVYPLFALAHRVFTKPQRANSEVDKLKESLLPYDIHREAIVPLSVCFPALEVSDTDVTFGLNTSGLPGPDFFLTINQDDSVLYSDGFDEIAIPMYPKYSDA